MTTSKVKVTLSLTQEALDLMLNNGYASERGMGEFIGSLIADYHRQRTRGGLAPAARMAALADELRQLAEELEVPERHTMNSTKQNLEHQIIACLDRYLEETGETFLSAPEANRILEQQGILKDRPERAGQPLRRLLRDKLIPHAYQVGSRWLIPHSRPQRELST